MVKLLEE